MATCAALYTAAPARSLRARGALELIIFLPFLLPQVLTGLSLLIMAREIRMPRGSVTVALGHSVFVLAVVYRVVLTRIPLISRSVLNASRDLGATRRQPFRYVLFLQLGSALGVAAMLAFTLSFDKTMTTFFVVGGDSTLPLRLYAMVRFCITPEINALFTLVLLFSVLRVFGATRLLRGWLSDNDP